jgi:cysteinyl-tRNA synthetase
VLVLCVAQVTNTGRVTANFSLPQAVANDRNAQIKSGRGFPVLNPWMVYYGSSKDVDLDQLAIKFRIMIIDADPHLGAFSATQIEQLKRNKQNRVLSYLNIGACENFRSYWKDDIAKPGSKKKFKSCRNTKAELGQYPDFPEEVRMNPANKDYQELILDYVSVQLQQQQVDGFFFDNMDIIEDEKLCNANCRNGGLGLVQKLRAKYPSLLFVMNGASGKFTLTGHVGNVAFPTLIDGIVRESVYKPTYDSSGEAELLAWEALRLMPGQQQFFIGTLDFVGDCGNENQAKEAYASSRAKGFSPYASDSTAGLKVICDWKF